MLSLKKEIDSIIELSADKLSYMTPNSIFASGYGYIKHPWFQEAKSVCDENGVTKVRWIATTGSIGDWAIYHSLDANFFEADKLESTDHLGVDDDSIYKYGAKLYDECSIKEFVPCTPEAFKKYRY